MTNGITRLTLPNGQWFDIKDALRVRDRKEVHSYSVDGVSADRQTYRFNVVKHQIATVAARVLNWSVTDDAGKVIPWPAGKSFQARVDVIEGLGEAEFDAISECLSTHLEAADAAAVKEKNATADGATDSTPSSPSAS